MTLRIIISLLLSILLFTGCATKPYLQPSLVTALTGIWYEESPESCGINSHSITVNGSNLIIDYVEKGYLSESDARKTFVYRILSAQENALRVQLENEPRLDAEGNPVVWHIMPLDTNTYCWGRDDWPPGACTPPRSRCN